MDQDDDGAGGTIDRDEVARFSALASRWWDEDGEFRPLHRINPVRLEFLRERLVRHFAREPRDLAPFRGLSLVDIGCGGGLVAEPMARLGFSVTGLDADPETLAVGRAHAAAQGLRIDYRCETAEALAASGVQFDAVLALEVMEHVRDVPLFVAACARLLRPGGAFLASTINRTPRSFVLAIAGAEYVLRWLPRGTHRWDRFLRPSEVAAALRGNGLEPREFAGLVFDLLHGSWGLSSDLAVNYLVFATQTK
ncbi:MAG TPA: bifunctional 2-polyprenyl-6-hydroxyphenol methylase/3-demethylubiquinol 3-O-methyltransferase UbiG [Stellaceae bacterium]|nr:bifunctional 2-polyprenyl-6-hydroxyphenol methylase/3-demethylubiquinol 3-O-methyltransferase UbiG [Stellaceae bacterium]